MTALALVAYAVPCWYVALTATERRAVAVRAKRDVQGEPALGLLTSRRLQTGAEGTGPKKEQRMADLVRLSRRRGTGWPRQRWEAYHASTDVFAFEPDPKECASLNSRHYPYSIRFLPVALGARDGAEGTLSREAPGCLGLLRPNMEFCRQYGYGEAMETVGECRIAISIGHSCEDFRPDVIKVDTQGTELDVIRGAGRLLDTVLLSNSKSSWFLSMSGRLSFQTSRVHARPGLHVAGLRRTYWREAAAHFILVAGKSSTAMHCTYGQS